METPTLVIINALVVFVAYIIWFVRSTIRRIEKDAYVHKRKGTKYLFMEYVKSKNPDTGEWYNAVRYCSLEDHKCYVREAKDFFDKFAHLSSWKSNNKQYQKAGDNSVQVQIGSVN